MFTIGFNQWIEYRSKSESSIRFPALDTTDKPSFISVVPIGLGEECRFYQSVETDRYYMTRAVPEAGNPKALN
jgi:hypothetical protein